MRPARGIHVYQDKPGSHEAGYYVHVVEAGEEPHTRSDAFAGRVAGPDLVTHADTLLLRIRLDSVPTPLEADR
jgi:hypothetical protein